MDLFFRAAAEPGALARSVVEQLSPVLEAQIEVALSTEAEPFAPCAGAPAFVGGTSPLSPAGVLGRAPAILEQLRLGHVPRSELLEPGEHAGEQAGAGSLRSPFAYWPLRMREHCFGCVVAVREPGRAELTLAELELGRHVAECAAAALEHARVVAEAGRELGQRRAIAERMRALAQASSCFAAATSNYQSLLEVVAKSVGEILGELCSIRLVSEDGQWLRAEDASVYHPDPAAAEAFRLAMASAPQRVGEGLAGSVAQSGEPLVLTETTGDGFAARTIPPYRHLARHFDPGSLMLLPLMSHGKCLGVLSVSRRRGERGYDEEDVRLGRDLADRAALAFENCALLTALARQIVELRAAEQRFRELLESAPDAIVLVESNGSMALVNARTEELFGYSRAELVGQPVASLLGREPDDAQPLIAPDLFQSRAAGARAALELVARRKDGAVFPVEINLSPLQTGAGCCAVAAIRDISARKKLEQSRAHAAALEAEHRRALETGRLQRELLANMSHELRTPLNAIIGFSSLVHAGKAGALTERQSEYLGDVLTSSRHLLQLINDVLDIVKAQAGRLDVRPEPVPIEELASEVRDIVRGLAPERSSSLRVRAAPELASVVTDLRLLKQILYNLLSNALRHTSGGGSIDVSIEPHADNFVIRVSDSGGGLRSDDLAEIFQEFRQLGAGAAEPHPTTGLGLALSKHIAEAQGGRLLAESVLGHGSTFTVELPRGPHIDQGARQNGA